MLQLPDVHTFETASSFFVTLLVWFWQVSGMVQLAALSSLVKILGWQLEKSSPATRSWLRIHRKESFKEIMTTIFSILAKQLAPGLINFPGYCPCPDGINFSECCP